MGAVSARRWLLPVVLGALALTGCSGAADADVHRVATDFYSALADADGAAACRLLAPDTREELEASSGSPCAEAVLAELDAANGDPSVVVSGSGARVRVGSDTAFLAEYAAGWLVTAAGCTPPPAPDRPYDCSVKGG